VGVVGRATTVTVVLLDLVGSSAEVAVMVTDCGVAGAVQAPVLALMEPALAVQLRRLVAPLVAVAVNVVVEFTSLVGAAGLRAPTATVCGVRVTLAVAVVPAALVTVRRKVLLAVMLPLPKAVPLVTTPTPLFTLPVPLLKVGVIVVVPAKGTEVARAIRLVATGAATTVTVVVEVLLGSSAEVAVMVTDWAVAGAVQAPVLAFMLPALADQVTPLVLPPVAVALKVVTVLTVLVTAAGVTAPTATVRGVSVTGKVPVNAPVTVSVKVFEAVMVPLEKVPPFRTTPTPLSTLPVPELKTAVMVVLPP